jgi:hypothetical protein
VSLEYLGLVGMKAKSAGIFVPKMEKTHSYSMHFIKADKRFLCHMENVQVMVLFEYFLNRIRG